MSSIPLLAAIQYNRGVPVIDTFRAVIAELHRTRTDVGGVLEEEAAAANADACRAHLNVVDIRTGEAARITQECGKDSRGCRLDERGLAAISPRIVEAIEARAALIIINKFGRAESEGEGLLACIADAISAGIPVLTSVREPYVEQWRTFHGGLGIELAPRFDAVIAWCDAVCGRKASALDWRVCETGLPAMLPSN